MDSGDAASEVATASLGAGNDPTITVTSPPNLFSYSWSDGGVLITMEVSVANAQVGPNDYHIQYFLDGELVDEKDAAVPYSFQGVPHGRHQLAARLVTAGGQVLQNIPTSLDKVYVKVVKVCGVADDCEDSMVCSNEACTGNTCNYGPVANCCDHDLDCDYGEICKENTCLECNPEAGDGASVCDDGNLCTNDYCDVSGACVNEAIAGCCYAESDCDDGDYCTEDTCDVGANECQHVAKNDPLCCNADSDCKPADPCMAYMCYENVELGYKKCRYGPSKPSCCTEDAGCNDGNPCTLNICSFEDPTDDSGTCIYETDPETPDCCVSNTDCDDDDGSTLDKCENNQCVHDPDPLYCELPQTSVLVINELMAAPGDIPDTVGEWIEIFNPSDQLVNLEGWKLETSGGEVHVFDTANGVGGASALKVFPGAYWVMARKADKTLNGGFVPNYQYGSDISLPDPYESGVNVQRTIWLKDAEGNLADSVTYDTSDENWAHEDGRSWSLTHMFAENIGGEHWSIAGTNDNPAKNVKYGDAENNLWGTPKNANTDVSAPLPHDGCQPGPDAHFCAFGACNVDSQCEFPLTEGCCTANEDCNDFDDCTLDACDTVNKICNIPQVDPECCTENSECNDGNPCNLDRCIGGTCRYSTNVVDGCCTADVDCDDGSVCTINTCDEGASQCNPADPIVLDGGEQCCTHDDDCDDGQPSTVDLCDFNNSPPVCLHADDPDYCESIDDPCDDGVKCTQDTCDVGAQQCLHEVVAGCCSKNSDCPSDNNPCTAEVCEASTGDCSSIPLEDCCLADSDCVDGNACTKDHCGAGNLCHNNPVDNCCNESSECDDGAECTSDTCVFDNLEVNHGTCENEQLSNCCSPGDSPAALIGACGPDPDGTATCFVWECSDQGQCNLLQNATCCTKDVDCEDGDPCTTDVCTSGNTCKHLQLQEGGACCVVNNDCADEDGKTCTDPVCTGGVCEELQIKGCAEPVDPPLNGGPDGDLEDGGWNPGAGANSCWKTNYSGFLGPDSHSECFGSQGDVGADAILSSPSFNPQGHDFVSVQFNAAWKNGSGSHTMTVYATHTEGVYDGAEVLDVIALDGENALSSYTYSLSNLMAAQNHVWIGWQIDSDTPTEVDVSVDDFVVSDGHAPFFVNGLQVDKTYDMATDRLTNAGTVSGQLGEVKHKVLWAHDQEWNSEDLSFELIGAPDFIEVIDTSKLFVYGVWQVKIAINAISADQIGTYPATLRVTDGGFVDEIPVKFVVDLGAGYVLWTPGGVANADGDALAAALSANNATFQQVQNLNDVNDWTEVLGLFVTTGGGPSSAKLTNSTVKKAVDFVNDGGDLYLEGSKTFGNDSQTKLQSKCKLSVVETDGGIFGPLAGKGVNFGGTWTYTNAPAYYNDADLVSPISGSGARTGLTREQDGGGLAITFDNPTGARSYCSTAILSRIQPSGSTQAELIGNVLEFFENGYGPCNEHSECGDGDPCTIDQCIGGVCSNSEDLDCDKCKSDSDCPDQNICKANGDCTPMPGDLSGPVVDDLIQGNCDTTDEQIFVEKMTEGFVEIVDVTTQIHLVLDPSQKMGTMELKLAHNGVVVTLVEPDPTNTDTELHATFDLGKLPIEGSMKDFQGQLLQGKWVLSIEDTTGGEACYTLESWDIFTTTKPIPACSSDADCDNGQACDGIETCNGGNCSVGIPLTADDCADPDPCTKDKCDPFANDGAGACVSPEREPSCAGAPCSGAHGFDAGDGQCGILDACFDGIDGGDGTCKLVCGTCPVIEHSGNVDTAIKDFQCVVETIDVTSENPYVSKVSVRTDVEHASLGDLSLKLVAPDGSGVTIYDQGDGDTTGLANYHSTFPDSNPKGEDALCALNGANPEGTWKVQICDEASGNEGVLHSWSIWVGTTAQDPKEGNSCDNAVAVDSFDTEGVPQLLSNSTQCFGDTTMGSCTGADGHDVVYKFTLPTRKRVTATLEAPGFDSGIYLTQSCSDGKSDFCSDTGGVGGIEKIDTFVETGTWFLVVDSALEKQYGDYTAYLEFQTPVANGQACDEDLDCDSAHCQNGFCCDAGDCCQTANDCPSEYIASATCAIAGTCQGHRVDPVCSSFACTTKNVDDDSACTLGTESKDCGLFVSVWCSGEFDQSEPACLTECSDDAHCDEGSHCYEVTSQCRLDNPLGAPCGENSDCSSDFCVDGVCCESACDGLCAQCDQPGAQGQCKFRFNGTDAEDECAGTGLCGGVCDGGGSCKYTPDTVACAECTRCDGAGFCENHVPVNEDWDDTCSLCTVCDGSGSCQAVALGQDPLSECVDDGAATCDRDGSCDGNGACHLYDPGTVCVTKSCTAGYHDPNNTCDGLGTCVNHDDVFCDGHVCNGPDCMEQCGHDGECITGYYCEDGSNGVANQCYPKKNNGDQCVVDHECTSNFCTDGVCCNAPCKGACRQCDGQPAGAIIGQCFNHPGLTDPEVGCGDYWCSGEGSCRTTCDPATNKVDGDFVGSTDCKEGFWCSGNQCEPLGNLGEFCTANHQCDSQICNLQDNVCCDKTCESTCETCKAPGNEGTCQYVAADSDPDEECAGTGTCGGRCNGSGSCAYAVPTTDCGGCKRCDGQGSCINVTNNTDPDNDCGLCETCNGNGQCKFVPANADLHDDCPASDVTTCGLDGQCTGTGQCQYHGEGAQASDPVCTGETLSQANTCDGAGGTIGGQDIGCAPYACQGEDVATNCPHPAVEYGGLCWIVTEPDQGYMEACTEVGLQKTSGWVSPPTGWNADTLQGVATAMNATSKGKHGCCASSAWKIITENALAAHNFDSQFFNWPASSTLNSGTWRALNTCQLGGGAGAVVIQGGTQCRTQCTDHNHCAAGYACDFEDANQNGRTDDCVAKKNNGSQCSADHECASDYCGNGFCCSGGDCCATNNSCVHLQEAAVCDYSNPGGCDGHRVDAYCDGNKRCQVVEVDDDTACASNQCQSAGCHGAGNLLWTQDLFCNASGSCNIGGTTLSCDDGNACTNDSCHVVDGCKHTDNNSFQESCYEGPSGTAGKGQCKAGIRTCDSGQLGLCTGQVLPGTEVCGGGDEDCDGQANEEGADGCQVYFRDNDGDGIGGDAYKCLCGPTGKYTATSNGDCDDNNAGAKPGNVEKCSTSYDDNCNSQANEDGAVGCSSYYFDGDQDGYGVGGAVCKCGPSKPYTSTSTGDCNDGNNAVNPGASEKCNGFDDNCNNSIDTQEKNAQQLCGDVPHASEGCSAGVCHITKCDNDWFDMDGLFSSGCEATEDQYDKSGWGDFCGESQYQSVGAGEGNYGSKPHIPDNGSSRTHSGTIVPHGDVDWIKAYFPDNWPYGKDFHLDIRFSSNPGDKYRFDVYRNHCGSKVCSNAKFYSIASDFNYNPKGNQNCVTGKSWSQNGQCGKPGRNCCHKNSEGADRTFHIRVFRPDGQGSGDTYKVFLSNNVY